MDLNKKIREKLLLEEVETKNTTKKGDYVVKNPTGEEYVLSEKKFSQKYYKTPLDDEDSLGFKTYENKPEERNLIKISKNIFDEILKEFEKGTANQKEFKDFMENYETFKAEKCVKVKARISDGGETIITKTKKKNQTGKTFKFKATWDEYMILKVGDYVVLNDGEAYRLGAEEYQKTYIKIKKN